MRKILMVFLLVLAPGILAAAELVSEVYPNLDLPILRWATFAKMDGKNILQADSISYSEAGLMEEIKKRYPELEKESKAHLLFFLEESLGRRLLVALARKEGHKDENEEEAIMKYLLSKVEDIRVEENEAKKFYEEFIVGVKEMPYDKVKDQIMAYLLTQKKKEAIKEFLNNFGKDKNIKVDKAWFQQSAKKLTDNPVDEARASGKITLVQFGADGCEPCELMKPTIKELAEKYKGKKNIIFVDVTRNRMLAVRYGVDMIHVQAFYDKHGKEIHRHVGYYSKEHLEKRLVEAESER